MDEKKADEWNCDDSTPKCGEASKFLTVGRENFVKSTLERTFKLSLKGPGPALNKRHL